MKHYRGFTLIELIMVIVILGILSAVAIPSYINLQSSAAQAAVDGMAGTMGAAMANNYAVRSSLGTSYGAAVAACSDVTNILQGGTPTGYTVTGTITTNPGTCTVSYTPSGGTAVTATFKGWKIT